MRKSAPLVLAVVFNIAFCFSSVPAQVSAGILNARAIKLPVPIYPEAAKADNPAGLVNVDVTVDETGSVISAQAVSGHPLLRKPAEVAARGAKFTPVRVRGQLVKVKGILIYNFSGTASWQEIGFILGAFESGSTDHRKNFAALSNRLPAEIADEKANFAAILPKIKVDPDSGNKEIQNVLNSIQKKLSDKKLEAWLLELGFVKGRIHGSLENERELTENLAAAKKLLETRPDGIAENLVDPLRQLSIYAGNVKFSEADKEQIKELSRANF